MYYPKSQLESSGHGRRSGRRFLLDLMEMIYGDKAGEEVWRLRWLDQDNGYHVCGAHPDRMFFQKRRGNNKYLIFATY
jgi:hypothetical protein